LRGRSPMLVDYQVESRQNLALARNLALAHATGDLVAFLDDDEFPGDDWLLSLFRTWRAFRVSGVLGPVIPHFDQPPPRWIAKSKIFNRPRYQTGYSLGWRQTRTGNVLLDRSILKSASDLFDEHFAMHGEDLDLFRRLVAKGHRFVWCDEAEVFETHPPTRLCRRYHMRRALLRGSVFYSHVPAKSVPVLKSIAALAVYVPALPVLLLFGQHHFMLFVVKCCDHIGRLMAFAGYRIEQHVRAP